MNRQTTANEVTKFIGNVIPMLVANGDKASADILTVISPTHRVAQRR